MDKGHKKVLNGAMNAILMSVSTVCKAIKDPKKRHECLDQLRSDLTELIVEEDLAKKAAASVLKLETNMVESIQEIIIKSVPYLTLRLIPKYVIWEAYINP